MVYDVTLNVTLHCSDGLDAGYLKLCISNVNVKLVYWMVLLTTALITFVCPMNEIKQLLRLPLELGVSVLVWVVQHAQPPVRGLQLILSSLRTRIMVRIRSAHTIKMLLYSLNRCDVLDMNRLVLISLKAV